MTEFMTLGHLLVAVLVAAIVLAVTLPRYLRYTALAESEARAIEQASEVGERLTQLESDKAALQARLEEQARAAGDKLKTLEQAREQLKESFEALANRILDEKSRKFSLQNKESLDALLKPLQEKISHFENTVKQTHLEDTKQRTSLEEKIRSLSEVNQEMMSQADKLARALTGQSKTRGDWGEMVLEKALELSGLQKGREYETQVSLRDDRGNLFRPDVLVRMPDDKVLLIDAKLALVDYTRFSNAGDDDEKARALKSHVEALRRHVRELSDKDYRRLQDVSSLDFVLMFVPVESALIEAMHSDPQLQADAFRQHVIIVTPSTLLASLRTIANLWQMERQQQNAREIARQAGALYDKFVGFSEDMKEIGKRLDMAKQAHEGAMNKLTDGKANLASRAEKLKAMGADPKKRLGDVLEFDEDTDG